MTIKSEDLTFEEQQLCLEILGLGLERLTSDWSNERLKKFYTPAGKKALQFLRQEADKGRQRLVDAGS